ncbi:hypothetical protein V490_03469 [Pseudogymnoascus sp. VKM F-3557]|nr:hypothetical protein V490_03469 [Pseudogymnoascus sp. VKM F-3557]
MHCQHLASLIPSLLVALLVGSATAAEQKCYGVNGVLAKSDIQPCNKDAPEGTFVACCNLGKSPPDICIKEGLCYTQDGLDIASIFMARGCTDPTGKDPACPQICPDVGALQYNLHACEDANWCCSGSGGKCCADKHIKFNPRTVLPPFGAPVTVTVSAGTSGTGSTKVVTETETKTVGVDDAGKTAVVCSSADAKPTAEVCSSADAKPTADGATADGKVTAEECPKDNTTVVGASVGAVLGAGLIASLIALGVVLRKQKRTGGFMGVGPDGKGVFYPAGTVPAEMDSRYVVELDSRAKHELEGGQSR